MNTLRNLTGKDFKFNKVEKRKIKAKFKELDKFKGMVRAQRNYNSLKEGNRKELFFNFANELTKVALNISNSANPVLDMTEYHIGGILSLGERYRFVRETNFLRYKEAIYNLIEEIYNQQKYNDIRKFSKTILTEDLFSTSQSAFGLLSIPDLLEQEFGPTTNSHDIKEYVDAYKELGMFMEKAVRILVAIKKNTQWRECFVFIYHISSLIQVTTLKNSNRRKTLDHWYVVLILLFIMP